MTFITGKQERGSSYYSIKQMALDAVMPLLSNTKQLTVADIGAGEGELTRLLAPQFGEVLVMDVYHPPGLPSNTKFVYTDLNESWPLDTNQLDVGFALEVIEHIENPRHFVREMKRLIKPGGYGFISTPNNLNFFSRLYFFLSGCHRFFQNSCYPAHISALVKIDFERILKENGLEPMGFFYNHQDVIPLLGVSINFRMPAFSNTIGVLFRKPYDQK